MYGLKPVPFKKTDAPLFRVRASFRNAGIVWLRRFFWGDFLGFRGCSGLSIRGGIHAAEGEFRFVAVEHRIQRGR